MRPLFLTLLLTACGGAIAPAPDGLASCGPLFQACMASPTAGESTCTPEGDKLSCECHDQFAPGQWHSNFCTYEAK
jgi:hypothetical protein